MKMLRMTEVDYQSHQVRVRKVTLMVEPKKDTIKRHTRHDRLRDELAEALIKLGHAVTREHLFAKPERAFRADICLIDRKFIIELQGQVHRIRDKWTKDILRTQWALIHGWIVFPVMPAQVESGEAIAAIQEALSPIPLPAREEEATPF